MAQTRYTSQPQFWEMASAVHATVNLKFIQHSYVDNEGCKDMLCKRVCD